MSYNCLYIIFYILIFIHKISLYVIYFIIFFVNALNILCFRKLIILFILSINWGRLKWFCSSIKWSSVTHFLDFIFSLLDDTINIIISLNFLIIDWTLIIIYFTIQRFLLILLILSKYFVNLKFFIFFSFFFWFIFFIFLFLFFINLI